MLEVYLMGILVSIVKLIDMADLSLGVGLACFVALLFTQVWLEVTMSPHRMGKRWAARTTMRALDAGILVCGECHQLNRADGTSIRVAVAAVRFCTPGAQTASRAPGRC